MVGTARALSETFCFHILFLLTVLTGEPCRMGRVGSGCGSLSSGL